MKSMINKIWIAGLASAMTACTQGVSFAPVTSSSLNGAAGIGTGGTGGAGTGGSSTCNNNLGTTKELTPEEFEIVKAHTVKGASILRPIEGVADLIPGIELHHESLDGQGYPYGLRGEEIPMMARIIAVADVFGALSEDRPYRASINVEDTFSIMKQFAPHQLDGNCLEALVARISSGGDGLSPARLSPVSSLGYALKAAI